MDELGLNKLKRECVDVQDASNLSGVLISWARWQGQLRDDANRMGIRYETHPANILFLSKVTSLMGVSSNLIGAVNRGEDDLFRTAWAWACDWLP